MKKLLRDQRSEAAAPRSVQPGVALSSLIALSISEQSVPRLLQEEAAWSVTRGHGPPFAQVTPSPISTLAYAASIGSGVSHDRFRLASQVHEYATVVGPPDRYEP